MSYFKFSLSAGGRSSEIVPGCWLRDELTCHDDKDPGLDPAPGAVHHATHSHIDLFQVLRGSSFRECISCIVAEARALRFTERKYTFHWEVGESPPSLSSCGALLPGGECAGGSGRFFGYVLLQGWTDRYY